MAVDLKLLSENDPLLKQSCQAWDFQADGDATELVRSMTKIMIENTGIGLAAPQVGVSKRIFVMGNEAALVACINPEILEASNMVMDREGCLSFPDLWLNVKRPDNIKVRYYNVKGEEIVREMSGLMSRVFQHELDHLDGICFTERVPKLSLEMSLERRKKKSR